jgi:LmbE family N-acetylglucosaminyl deacetylase
MKYCATIYRASDSNHHVSQIQHVTAAVRKIVAPQRSEMNVLVIAPHPDDETIGCGGALYLHACRGDRVSAAFLTSGEVGLKKLPVQRVWTIREQEARRAGKILGLAELFFLRQPDWKLCDHVTTAATVLRTILKREMPTLIYIPHPSDSHPDHQATWPIVRTALKRSGLRAPTIRAYEIWTQFKQFDVVEDISAVMPRKLRALQAYRSQLGVFDYERAILGLNQYRGALAAKSRYAEVFQTLFW